MEKITEQVVSFLNEDKEEKITFIKPASGDYEGELIWIYQNSYGVLEQGINTIKFITLHFPWLVEVQYQLKRL